MPERNLSGDEIWRPIRGLEGRYEISNLGNVRSLDRYAKTRHAKRFIPGGPINPSPVGAGYLRAILGRGVGRYIHHMVLESFVGPRPDGCEACHNDGDKTNNHIDNLRWDTKQNNERDKDRHGTRVRFSGVFGERSGMAKLTNDKVREIRRRLLAGESQQSIGTIVGVCQSAVSSIKLNKTWKHVA